MIASSGSATAWSIVIGLYNDLRYAVRSQYARPVFAIATILLTAIAAAACLTAFAIAYGILWRPLSYPESERLAVLWEVRRGEQGQISYPDYADLSRAAVFDGAAVISGGRMNLHISDVHERVTMNEIEAQGLPLLGAQPVAGRLINAGDAGQPVVMISHRLWTSRLGGDSNVIGRLLSLSGRDYTIAGVLPRGFGLELPITPTLKLEQPDVLMAFDSAHPKVHRREVSTYEAIVRLAPATTIEEAQVAIDSLAARLAVTYPGTNAERTFRIVPLKSEMVRAVRTPLLLVCVAALAALAVALANLVALTLVRIMDRRAELAIRQALGAGPSRIRRQLFTEHLMTTLVGTAAGFLVAMRVTRALIASEAADLPRPEAIQFDAPVQLVAICLIGLIGGVLTLLPLRAGSSEISLRAAVRGPSRSARPVRRVLVAGELALALGLSAGSVLLGLSLVRLFAIDPGFTSTGVVSARVSAYESRYPTLEDVETFFGSVLHRIESMPEVARAAAGWSLPLSGQMTGTSVLVEGRNVPAGSRQPSGWEFVTPGYFDVLGVPMVRGRDFTPADRGHAGHVTVINEALARALFGHDDPLGRRITTDDGKPDVDWHTVIGVVGDVRHHALNQSPAPRMYDLFGEHWGQTMYVVAKTRQRDAAPVIPGFRRVIAEVDREAPVFEVATMSGLAERSAAPYRLSASLAAGLAAVSTLLALLGVFAVSAASVSERTHEIGIRAALGAAPADLLRLVLGEGATTAAAGAAVGLATSVATAWLLYSQLFGVRLEDLTLIIPAVAAAMLIVGIAAALPAARRAAHADPLVAMRTE